MNHENKLILSTSCRKLNHDNEEFKESRPNFQFLNHFIYKGAQEQEQ